MARTSIAKGYGLIVWQRQANVMILTTQLQESTGNRAKVFPRASPFAVVLLPGLFLHGASINFWQPNPTFDAPQVKFFLDWLMCGTLW